MKTLEWKHFSKFLSGCRHPPGRSTVLLLTVWKVEVKPHSSGNVLAEQNVSRLLQRRNISDSVPSLSCSNLSICVLGREERSAYVGRLAHIRLEVTNHMRQFLKLFLACSTKQARQEMPSVKNRSSLLFWIVCLFVFQVTNFSRFSLSNLKSIEFFSYKCNQVHTL